MSNLLQPSDHWCLKAAIAQAEKSYRQGGIPIGSALQVDGVLVGLGHNRRVQHGNAILHAEMDCFQNAGRLSPEQYKRATLYSTLSPCAMCSGTILMYGVPRVVVADVSTWRDDLQLLSKYPENVDVIVSEVVEIQDLLARWIEKNPSLWSEDVGGAV